MHPARPATHPHNLDQWSVLWSNWIACRDIRRLPSDCQRSGNGLETSDTFERSQQLKRLNPKRTRRHGRSVDDQQTACGTTICHACVLAFVPLGGTKQPSIHRGEPRSGRRAVEHLQQRLAIGALPRLDDEMRLRGRLPRLPSPSTRRWKQHFVPPPRLRRRPTTRRLRPAQLPTRTPSCVPPGRAVSSSMTGIADVTTSSSPRVTNADNSRELRGRRPGIDPSYRGVRGRASTRGSRATPWPCGKVRKAPRREPLRRLPVPRLTR